MTLGHKQVPVTIRSQKYGKLTVIVELVYARGEHGVEWVGHWINPSAESMLDHTGRSSCILMALDTVKKAGYTGVNKRWEGVAYG